MPKKANKPKRSQRGVWLVVGRISLARINGKVWLRNAIGEAMPATEATLGALLERFFNRHF